MTTEHDHPEAPEQIVPQSLNDYLEVMTKPESTDLSGGGTGRGHNRDGDVIVQRISGGWRQ